MQPAGKPDAVRATLLWLRAQVEPLRELCFSHAVYTMFIIRSPKNKIGKLFKLLC